MSVKLLENLSVEEEFSNAYMKISNGLDDLEDIASSNRIKSLSKFVSKFRYELDDINNELSDKHFD